MPRTPFSPMPNTPQKLTFADYIDLQKQGQLAALGWAESHTGAGNSVEWTVTCKVNGDAVGTAVSHQKGAAKEEAARQALVKLGLLSG
ncbi:hypothetical protein BC628DRAFT_1416288 [Trametes gibbosa]|nr:hypothetical protein BC628DRAFT_1416288 [Trametes gibbosa]